MPARRGSLGGYRAKRDFTRTPEPPAATGTQRGPSAEPRFVIHEHHARRVHWDLRLEHDGVLASWAIPKGLPPAPGENRFAAATEDHPLEYLDFDGEIPAGQYGAGRITIWDRGSYECLKWEPRKIEIALHGTRPHARYALFAIDTAAGEPKDWMIHRMDPPADPDREPMPARIVPMLARGGELPEQDGGWAYEVKWDGVRAIAYCEPGELRLESRNMNVITDSYPELARMTRALGSRSAVLDGELVAFDDAGRPSFGALQRRMHVSSRAQAQRLTKDTPVAYVIFDLLWLDGHSLMDLPYSERTARLAALELDGERWQTPGHVLGDGREVLRATVEQGLEGVLAKRLDSPYRPGLRSREWVKVKSLARQEFVIGGWMPGKGKRRESIGSLLLGVHDGPALRYAGRVGSGLTERELVRLAGLLGGLERASPPFAAGEPLPPGALFCEPRLVCEVAFSEWTSAGSLRHPTYHGLRSDISPEDVIRENGSPAAGPAETMKPSETPGGGGVTSVGGRELRLSNVEKLLYPRAGFSKRQVIDYYAAIAPILLGHLQGRALTVKRWPDGVEGKSFFQKQAPAHRPEWVTTVTLASERKPIDYLLAGDVATIVWLANLAALELHTPLALAEAIERPTTLVFDLDPGEGATLLDCCRVGLQLHGMFENLGLETFAKTSGLKGLQLYLPLNSPTASFEQTKPFAKTVAELLEAEEPDLVVSRMTKARRAGRVLIDWSQNDRRKTTVCAYSLRAAERPTVSTPLSWEEIRGALDAGDRAALVFEAPEVLERVALYGDLLAPILSLVQELPAT